MVQGIVVFHIQFSFEKKLNNNKKSRVFFSLYGSCKFEIASTRHFRRVIVFISIISAKILTQLGKIFEISSAAFIFSFRSI